LSGKKELGSRNTRDEEYIEKVAQYISKKGMETPAIMLLHTFKPLAFMTAELASFFLAPFLILIGEESFKIIDVFEKTKNLEKLIKKIEEKSQKKEKKEGFKSNTL
jgi:hypothetical protein